MYIIYEEYYDIETHFQLVDDKCFTTYEKAENVTTSFSSTLFKWNTDITSFNELKEFKNITYINGESFFRCSSLESIDLSNITDIGYNCFDSCTSLTSVGDLSKMTRIKRYIFASSSLLTRLLFHP